MDNSENPGLLSRLGGPHKVVWDLFLVLIAVILGYLALKFQITIGVLSIFAMATIVWYIYKTSALSLRIRRAVLTLGIFAGATILGLLSRSVPVGDAPLPSPIPLATISATPPPSEFKSWVSSHKRGFANVRITSPKPHSPIPPSTPLITQAPVPEYHAPTETVRPSPTPMPISQFKTPVVTHKDYVPVTITQVTPTPVASPANAGSVNQSGGTNNGINNSGTIGQLNQNNFVISTPTPLPVTDFSAIQLQTSMKNADAILLREFGFIKRTTGNTQVRLSVAMTTFQVSIPVMPTDWPKALRQLQADGKVTILQTFPNFRWQYCPLVDCTPAVYNTDFLVDISSVPLDQ